MPEIKPGSSERATSAFDFCVNSPALDFLNINAFICNSVLSAKFCKNKKNQRTYVMFYCVHVIPMAVHCYYSHTLNEIDSLDLTDKIL